ncbi:hypothetical protein DMX10_25570 [Pseudomonas sp. 57B-090624]|nr:hypothetical protein DMX10_25570 [Pseudomonas sp. 57B-090624]
MIKTTPPTRLRSPRDYAAAILAEPSREQRIQLLERCPPEWREQAETHVKDAWARMQAYRRHREERHAAAKERPPRASRPSDRNTNITNHPRSEPEVGNRHLAALRALVGDSHGN